MDDLDHNLSTEHQREGDARRSKDTLDRDRTGGIPANREKSEPFVRDDEQEQAEERADLEELQTGQTGDLGEQGNENETNRTDTQNVRDTSSIPPTPSQAEGERGATDVENEKGAEIDPATCEDHAEYPQDRKSVEEGKRGAVRVDLGGRRIVKKKNII